MTDWKSLFRRHQALERAWCEAVPARPLAMQFFRRIVHGAHTEASARKEIESFGLEPPLDLVREGLSIRSCLDPADRRRPEGRHPEDPLEDVYAAALSMLPHGYWVVSPDRAQLYRGQRDANWSTVPSLFRSADVDAALEHLACAMPRIRACLPDASEEQAVAVAQHYAKELGVETWLLDMTYDPRVALFFASDGGRAGDVGLVVSVVHQTWSNLSAGGTNRLGRLHVIDVPGARRIEHQRASFLDTSHPDLFEQYVGDTVWFRQVEGLCFEDPDDDFPVTAERIYPADDPLCTALLGTPPASHGTLGIGPAGDARAPLDAAAYLEIAGSWCRQEGVTIDAYREDTLKVVCDVHALLQQQRSEFAVADRSLQRLWDAVGLVMDAQRNGATLSPHEAMRWSLSRLEPAARERLDRLITACKKARDLC